MSASNLFKTNPGIVLWCMGIDCLYDLAVKLSHGLVEDRQPVSLSTEDALTVGWAWAAWSTQFSTSTGMDAPIKAAGITTCTMEWVGMCMPVSFMHNVATPSDDRNLAFCLLFLEISPLVAICSCSHAATNAAEHNYTCTAQQILNAKGRFHKWLAAHRKPRGRPVRAEAPRPPTVSDNSGFRLQPDPTACCCESQGCPSFLSFLNKARN